MRAIGACERARLSISYNRPTQKLPGLYLIDQIHETARDPEPASLRDVWRAQKLLERLERVDARRDDGLDELWELRGVEADLLRIQRLLALAKYDEVLMFGVLADHEEVLRAQDQPI